MRLALGVGIEVVDAHDIPSCGFDRRRIVAAATAAAPAPRFSPAGSAPATGAIAARSPGTNFAASLLGNQQFFRARLEVPDDTGTGPRGIRWAWKCVTRRCGSPCKAYRFSWAACCWWLCSSALTSRNRVLTHSCGFLAPA